MAESKTRSVVSRSSPGRETLEIHRRFVDDESVAGRPISFEKAVKYRLGWPGRKKGSLALWLETKGHFFVRDQRYDEREREKEMETERKTLLRGLYRASSLLGFDTLELMISSSVSITFSPDSMDRFSSSPRVQLIIFPCL